MKNGYFMDPEQKKYTKTYIIEALLTSQFMNINFQKVIFWIYADKFYFRSAMWLVWKNSDEKDFFDPEQKKYTKNCTNLLRVGCG